MAFLRLWLVCCIVLVVSGCSHVVPRYGLSANNIQDLKSMRSPASKPIAVNDFSSREPGKSSIMCRAAGPVETPDGKPFEAYLRDALVSELQIAELYDAKSPILVRGVLDHIDFSSHIGDGYWTIRMTFEVPPAAPFTVENRYTFSTAFIADRACAQVAQALLPATQDFYKAVFARPEFRRIVAGR